MAENSNFLTPEIMEAVWAVPRSTDRSFLVITAPATKLDPIADTALKETRKYFAVDEDRLLAKIQKAGLATEISKVTKRLNRMRLSEMRRQVLAATYLNSLYYLLSKGKADPHDTLGFAEAVLFDQEQDRIVKDPPMHTTSVSQSASPQETDVREPAPLTKFVYEIVHIVKTQNRIDLTDLETELIIRELLGADLSLKPGRVKPAVMDRLTRIIKQGAMPALVEKFIDRGEINPTKFTPAIKQAMVEYLLDRGVQVVDSNVFDSGGYDEHFVVAYERAISAASGKQDPIDNARLNGSSRAFAPWDFTVETFDGIEEQGIVKENILAAGAADYIYELGERMGVYRLVDALVLNWSSGAIDVASSAAADKLYRYWKLREERSSPEERGMLYKRVLNKGNANLLSRMVVNEHFPALWHNLMAKVAEYIDKTERVEEGMSEASPVSRSTIYQATRELQYNLTEFCTGMAHMQVRELYAQLQEAFDILGDPEIIDHFGGTRRKTMWTVIEQLSKTEFGVAPNIAAVRTLAVDGNRVFQWIANFNEATVSHEEFLTFLEAAESYVLNIALVGEDVEADIEDDEWGEDDWDDDFKDDFDDF